jgi:hypothetical protein
MNVVFKVYWNNPIEMVAEAGTQQLTFEVPLGAIISNPSEVIPDYPSFTGNAAKVLTVNATEDDVEWTAAVTQVYVDTQDGSLQDQIDLKADAIAVSQSLALKADLIGGLIPASQLPSYIDEELDLKAPKETTYTKLEVDFALSTKAPQTTTYTKTEVDTAFATYAGGRKAYTTLALAQTAQSSLPANTSIEVTNDPTASNNGTYQWNGTTLTKSAYDPLHQAKLSAASLSVVGEYLTEASKREIATLSETSQKYLIAKAIKKVAITNPTAGKQYKINSVYKNAGASGSRIVINDDVGSQASISIPAATVVSGLQEYTLSGLKSGKVLIDWDVLGANVSTDGLDLFFDNNIFLQEYLNTAAIAQNAAAIAQNVTAIDSVKPALLSDWVLPSQASAVLASSDTVKKVMYAIKGIEIKNASVDQYLKLATVTKEDATYGTRFFIVNSSSQIVLQYLSSSSKSGVETVQLVQNNSSGLTGSITINWDEIPSGLLISGVSPLLIKWNSTNFASARTTSEKNATDIAVLQASISTASGSSKVATKAYRVAIAGSSITWGQGYLGEGSYVGTVEQILRNQYAKTIHASTIATSATTLTGNDFYLGSAKRISGLNTQISFTLDGDELSLSIGRERENTGACLVELYVDNVLYDTFNTSNPKPSVTRTENFTGNGTDLKFNLDGAFTYAHSVTVDGVAKVGSVSSQSSGATIPASDDYMIVRRYDTNNKRVVHSVWFKTAPTGAIVITYKQGENIRHLKGTIDRVGAGFTSTLENPYGDGNVSYDTTNPVAVSSGLGFRQSDSRAVKTWKFSESKTRSYKLKIQALHSSATGSTPYLDLNFVTNRMHHVMNAGIGGWSAYELLNNTVKINTINEVINFNPDIVLIESSTNDDWSTGMFKAYVTKTGVTNAEILNSATANYYTSITGTSDNKTVNDVRLPMTAIDSTSVTLASNVVDTSIAVGDAVIIGDYGCNHKRVAVRTIKAYDSATKKITLNRSISVDDFYQATTLNDVLTEFVTLYNAPTWVSQNTQLVDTIESALPDCKVNIATAGIPHFYLRKLFGYREIAQKVSKDNHIGFVDYFDATFDYQYSQQVSTHQTITSTGASQYVLTGLPYTFPNPKVFVNGVEHKKVRITGGLSKHWASGVTDPTLANTSNMTRSFKLIFDVDVPSSGATIVVQKSATVWANDYCHPTGPQGFWVLGQAAAKILKDVN